MTPAQIDPACRLVALKGWRWPSLNRGTLPRVFAQYDHGEWAAAHEIPGLHVVPDLSSPLVVGWVLHLLREAAGDPLLHAAPCLDANGEVYEWRVWSEGVTRWWSGPTEIEAIINALAALEEA